MFSSSSAAVHYSFIHKNVHPDHIHPATIKIPIKIKHTRKRTLANVAEQRACMVCAHSHTFTDTSQGNIQTGMHNKEKSLWAPQLISCMEIIFKTEQNGGPSLSGRVGLHRAPGAGWHVTVYVCFLNKRCWPRWKSAIGHLVCSTCLIGSYPNTQYSCYPIPCERWGSYMCAKCCNSSLQDLRPNIVFKVEIEKPKHFEIIAQIFLLNQFTRQKSQSFHLWGLFMLHTFSTSDRGNHEITFNLLKHQLTSHSSLMQTGFMQCASTDHVGLNTEHMSAGLWA